MKAALFACLLVVAGAVAMPQQDIAASQGRIMDLVVKDWIGRATQYLVENGWDPLDMNYYEFDETLIPGSVYVTGFTENLFITGLSNVVINHINYSLLLGRLDMDVAFEEVKMKVGKYVAAGRYGLRGGVGELSGSLKIKNLRFVIDTLLSWTPGAPVLIHNINSAITLGDIQADLAASWKCLGCQENRDISSCVNNILNNRVPEWLEIYKLEIGTLFSEAVRRYVNNRWWW